MRSRKVKSHIYEEMTLPANPILNDSWTCSFSHYIIHSSLCVLLALCLQSPPTTAYDGLLALLLFLSIHKETSCPVYSHVPGSLRLHCSHIE